MAVRDAEATKARILAASVAEFAHHGLAGARIDRIASAANANKRMIYVYFGNKDKLFDAVIDAAIGEMFEAVPFTPRDLPEYGAKLFDFLVAHPVEIRIDAWRRLERPVHTALEEEIFVQKVAALDAVRSTTQGALSSADLLVAVLAAAWSWVTVPTSLAVLATEDVAVQRQHVVSSIEALCRSQG